MQAATARRIRESRERKKLGLRCITIEIRDAEINALVEAGLLASETRGNRQAIEAAFGVLLDRVSMSQMVKLLIG